MSPTIGLCFCHGWGFTPDFWKPLAKHFPQHPLQFWNLGYQGSRNLELPHQNYHPSIRWVAIGHSLGLRTLLESPHHWHGIVALQSFTHFLTADPRLQKVRHRFLEKMIRDWKQNPTETLQKFLSTSGFPDSSISHPLSFSQLESDLESLLKPGNFTLNPTLPHRILASPDDPIVPPQVIESEWKNFSIQWSPPAKHGLGFLESDFVAQSIHSLISEGRSYFL